MNRHIKQLVYGFFYLVILVFIGIGFYLKFIKAAPSCFDKKQNQNEEGIDCGGTCSKICLPPDFTELKVKGVARVFHLTESKISLFAEIENPNRDFAARNFSYNFIIYDASDQILKTIPGTSLVYEKDTTYLLAPNLDIDPKAKYADIKINQTDWVKSATFPKPQVSSENIQITSFGQQIKVTGSLTNQNSFPLAGVKVMAIFFNSFEKPIGASLTEIDNIAPGESQPFSISHPSLSELKSEATKIFVFAQK